MANASHPFGPSDELLSLQEFVPVHVVTFRPRTAEGAPLYKVRHTAFISRCLSGGWAMHTENELSCFSLFLGYLPQREEGATQDRTWFEVVTEFVLLVAAIGVQQEVVGVRRIAAGIDLAIAVEREYPDEVQLARERAQQLDFQGLVNAVAERAPSLPDWGTAERMALAEGMGRHLPRGQRTPCLALAAYLITSCAWTAQDGLEDALRFLSRGHQGVAFEIMLPPPVYAALKQLVDEQLGTEWPADGSVARPVCMTLFAVNSHFCTKDRLTAARKAFAAGL